jgi:uncharacterized protein YqeY
MSIEERLMADLKAAMKAGPSAERRKSTIRLVRAAIHNAQIDLRRPLTEAEVEELLRRQVKQRRDSIDAFRAGGREELAAGEQAEIDVIQQYLPQQLSAEAVTAVAREVIAATGAQSLADLGQVMPVIMARLKGQAEGRTINQVVRHLLSGTSDQGPGTSDQ